MRSGLAALVVVGFALAAPAAHAFVFRIGDTVYVDGKQYSWDEWKKIRDTYQREAPPKSTEPVAMVKPVPASAADSPHAASCSTSIYYDEFPPDDERFECSAGLGALTREELLRQGWKVDLIEKIPSAGGQPSPRGLPLYRYKLVISR